MSIFKKKLKVNIENLGLAEDLRPAEEKEKDFRAEELFAAFVPYSWQEKPESQWRKFTRFFQDQSSSCVMQAVAKALGIENYLEEKKFIQYSARDGYTRRSNFPQEGMIFVDAMNIAYKKGLTLEQLMPSQGLSESLMNGAEDRTPFCEIVAQIGKAANFVQLPINIDAIASVIEPLGKPVILGVRFGQNEWFGKKVPEVLNIIPKWGHGICATNATLYGGKKAIIIEDSAYWDGVKESVRVITEDWFTKGRIVFAGYFLELKNDGLPDKPKAQFNQDLSYGMVNNEDVRKLQQCLAYMGLFPTRDLFTGNFYGITLKGVKAFQVLQGINPDGIANIETRQKLNEIFA
jgi:hypothetical protein